MYSPTTGLRYVGGLEKREMKHPGELIPGVKFSEKVSTCVNRFINSNNIRLFTI